MGISIKDLVQLALDFNINIYYRLNRIKILLKGFSYLGSGRHRFVFRSPNGRYVLKFPINSEGLYANWDEDLLYKYSLNKAYSYDEESYAPCKLIGNTILMMRYVKDISFDYGRLDSLPIWVIYVDCCQVGYLKDNKLVSYDYSRI